MNPGLIARLVGTYATAGSLYIFFSDALLFDWFPDLATAHSVGVIKGLAFIGVTSLVLAWFLNRLRVAEEARNHALFSRHPAVMLLVDPGTGCVVDATPDAERFYGLSRAQLLARTVNDMEAPATPGSAAPWRDVLAGQVGICRVRQVAAGGELRDVVVHAGPLLRDGRTLRFLIIQDESPRMRLVTELERAEARWRFALEGAGHGVWEWNVQTGEVYFSHQWKVMLGYADEEIAGNVSEWESRVHPDDVAAVNAALEAHFAGRAPIYRSEHRVRCKDGSWKWVADLGKVIERSGDGQPLLMIGTHTDITDQKHNESRIRESERRYRELFEGNPHAMWVYDRETLRFLAVNDAAVAKYGYSREEFLSMTIRDIRPAEDIPRLMQKLATAVDGFDNAGVWRHRRRDGSLIDVEITTHSMSFTGRPAEVVLVDDITDRLKAEVALRESESRYRALAQQSLVGIYIVDGDHVDYMNPRAAEIFGYQEHEIPGMPVASLVAAQDRATVATNVRRRLAGEVASLQYEFTGVRKDGTQVLIGVHGTAAEIGGRTVVTGVLQDITDKKRAEDTIRDYVQRLEAAVLGTAAAVSQMVELRDPYTAGHERRVGELAAAIAGEMGLDPHTRRGLRVAGAVHDVGKIVVPSEILTKPGRLSPVEMELVRQHAQQGYEVLKDVPFPWPVAEVARQHHERIDGSGYPRGLKGDEILLEARILAVADVVESMSSHRPYRPGLGLDKALLEIERNAGMTYDAAAAQACLRLFRDRGYEIPD